MEMPTLLKNQMREHSSTCSIDEIKCPVCGGRGWILSVDADGYESATRCECLKKEIERNRLKFANIPEHYRNIRLSDLTADAYSLEDSKKMFKNDMDAINYWLSDIDNMLEKGIGLFLYSDTKGSGKTQTAYAIANELLNEKQIQVKFCTSTQIIEEIKKSWNGEGEATESELINYLKTTTVLVIDDFGTENVKDWIGEKFYSIINYRYVEKKPTIVTSNYSPSNLPYNDRINNRIKEMTYRIPFPEESVRERIAKKNDYDLVKGMKAYRENRK